VIVIMRFDAEILRHLDAAEGWLLLGNVNEATAALDNIAPESRAAASVLMMRCAIYRHAERWQDLEVIASGAWAMHPDFGNFKIFLAAAKHKQGKTEEALRLLSDTKDGLHANAPTAYSMACMYGGKGQIAEAKHWLSLAFEWSHEPEKLKLRALGEPDLEAVWRAPE
jgi:predicted Zn-dependent protease